MSDETNSTIPLDPSVPGLWWVQADKWWRAWEWRPALELRWLGYWHTGDSAISAQNAYAAGWRCIAPAVPPEVT